MEVHIQGLDSPGVNKGAYDVYNPEYKDVVAPPLSHIPAGENFAVHASIDTAAVHIEDELRKNVGVDSKTTLNPGFSLPSAVSNFNNSPDIVFQAFDNVETKQDPQHEINHALEQDEPFDDMVILENDVVMSATVALGAGCSRDGFQATDSQMEEFHEAPVLDIDKTSSVAADAAAMEENVNETTLDMSAALPAEAKVTLTSDVTGIKTVNDEVTDLGPLEVVTAGAATDLPIPADNELPSTPASNVLENNEPHEIKDTSITNIAADNDTAQNNEPTGGYLPISDKDILGIKGQKVVKKFGKKNYCGNVVDFDPETKWFKVVYEDGDDEDLELSEVKEILASTKKKRLGGGDDAHADSAGKTAKKPRKTSSASIAKKSRIVSDSLVNSPKTPESKVKGSKNLRKSTGSKKAKSPAKLIKRALNSLAFKMPANSEVKGEKRKSKTGTVMPKGTKDFSPKERNEKTPTNWSLSSAKSQKSARVKTSAGSPSAKRATVSGSKRKEFSGKSRTEQSKRSRKAALVFGMDTQLVGNHVRKEFDGSLYDGVVVKFDKRTEFYKVKYADGDQEDLELHELEPILVHDLSNADEKDDKPAKLSSSSFLTPAGKVSGTRKKKL